MTENPFKVLVADDEESLRGIVEEVLTDAGYTVECVENGKDALEKIKGDPKIQVLITDIRMPEMDGIELLEKVKEARPEVEVVIMTSHGSLDTAIKAIRLGAYDYLQKPFEDLDVISTVIDRTCAKLKLEMEVKRLVEELKARNEDIQALYDCTAELATTLDTDQLLVKATDFLTKLGHCPMALYYSFDAEKQEICGHKGTGWKGGEFSEQKFEIKGAKVVENYFHVIDTDSELKKRLALAPRPQQVLIFSMFISEEVDGVFVLVSENDWTDQRKALVHQFVETIATQLEKAQLHQRVSELAIRDGLTGLYNHRYFQNTLQTEIERARRYKNKLSIILFDIDHFKHYNDTNGHPMGDELLKTIGGLISHTLRKIDLAARYGGEEFVVVAAETEKEGAVVLAERLREAIAKYEFKNREKQPKKIVSVSVGVAEFPSDGETKEAVIQAADKALYKAKEGGRNQVVVAGTK